MNNIYFLDTYSCCMEQRQLTGREALKIHVLLFFHPIVIACGGHVNTFSHSPAVGGWILKSVFLAIRSALSKSRLLHELPRRSSVSTSQLTSTFLPAGTMQRCILLLIPTFSHCAPCVNTICPIHISTANLSLSCWLKYLVSCKSVLYEALKYIEQLFMSIGILFNSFVNGLKCAEIVLWS